MLKAFAHLAAFLLMASASVAEELGERITSYDVSVTLDRENVLTVIEDISIVSEGKRIRRGLFRDFPWRQNDTLAQLLKQDFQVLSVERNGQPEKWRAEQVEIGTRIYTGSETVFLPFGPHRYRFTYKISKHIRDQPGNLNLAWDVVGGGWDFVVEKASITLHLPPGVIAQSVGYSTGIGGTQKNARFLGNLEKPVVETTERLSPNEGFRVAFALPSGAIKHAMDAALLELYFQNYVLGKFCAEKGAAFTSENVAAIEKNLTLLMTASDAPKSLRDEVWRSVNARFDAVRDVVTRQDCTSTRVKAMYLYPEVFKAAQSESPF
ncbi:DUF2207 domain-containing protein [Neorhizobium sp. T25_27]|uniref:DUF2207 domain-containing protein n=1 Tax=Neorhizobium sp. T25_27 TaxID=2093831 RepID=UPI000CFA7323|nr:DUF2207 domain-containing protein [Neorhizobium sp. T25_27]